MSVIVVTAHSADGEFGPFVMLADVNVAAMFDFLDSVTDEDIRSICITLAEDIEPDDDSGDGERVLRAV